MRRLLVLAASVVVLTLVACPGLPIPGGSEHDGAITADETWTKANSPHIIKGDVAVENNATLTIEAGCTVKFDPGTELYCGYAGPGAIVAVGTASSPILFTSNVAVPSPGDYSGIGIYARNMNSTHFSHCTIEYASERDRYGAFSIEADNARIDNCTVRLAKNYGVFCGSSAHFDDFTGNTITTCGDYPLHIATPWVTTIGTGNTFTGNTHDGIEVQGGTVSETGTWSNFGVPYIIDGNVAIEGDVGPVLTIEAGTTLQLRPEVEFYVGYAQPGGLIANGTAASPITFTSSVATPSAGDWNYVSVYARAINAQSQFRYCTIEYGGPAGEHGLMLIVDASPTVQNCTFRHSLAWGIYMVGDLANLPDPVALEAGNTFSDCPSGHIRVP